MSSVSHKPSVPLQITAITKKVRIWAPYDSVQVFREDFLDIKKKLTRIISYELNFIDFSCVFACDLVHALACVAYFAKCRKSEKPCGARLFRY